MLLRAMLIFVLLLLSVPVFLLSVTPVGAAESLIAYAGTDGNIWTMRSDGSGQQRLTNANPQQYFVGPRWSPGGTMLTFESRRKGNQIDSRDGIYLYHNGTSTRLPGLNMCESPAFMPGGQRLALSCGRRYDSPPRQYTPEQLQNDPALAAVSSVNLDGSDWRTLVPYAPVIRSDHPCCGYGVSRIEFSPADGAMLLNIGRTPNDSARGFLRQCSPPTTTRRWDLPPRGCRLRAGRARLAALALSRLLRRTVR
jgi:hypothetical protein